MADGAASVKVAADAGQGTSLAEVAAGAPSAEVAADAKPAGNQDPEAEGAQPTDPEAPPKWLNTTTRDQPDTMSVGRDDLRRREWHKLVQRKLRALMRRLRALTWPGCVR